MIDSVNQYGLGNINKVTKFAYLTYPTVAKYKLRKPIYIVPRHFKLPNERLEVDNWILYNFLEPMDMF